MSTQCGVPNDSVIGGSQTQLHQSLEVVTQLWSLTVPKCSDRMPGNAQTVSGSFVTTATMYSYIMQSSGIIDCYNSLLDAVSFHLSLDWDTPTKT